MFSHKVFILVVLELHQVIVEETRIFSDNLLQDKLIESSILVGVVVQQYLTIMKIKMYLVNAATCHRTPLLSDFEVTVNYK